MKISELRNKVQFLREKKIANDTYGFDYHWIVDIETHGKLESLLGRDTSREQNAELLSTHRLTIRSRDNVTHDMRVKVRDTYYKIVQIDPLVEGRSRYMEIILEQEKEVI